MPRHTNPVFHPKEQENQQEATVLVVAPTPLLPLLQERLVVARPALDPRPSRNQQRHLLPALRPVPTHALQHPLVLLLRPLPVVVLHLDHAHEALEALEGRSAVAQLERDLHPVPSVGLLHDALKTGVFVERPLGGADRRVAAVQPVDEAVRRGVIHLVRDLLPGELRKQRREQAQQGVLLLLLRLCRAVRQEVVGSAGRGRLNMKNQTALVQDQLAQLPVLRR